MEVPSSMYYSLCFKSKIYFNLFKIIVLYILSILNIFSDIMDTIGKGVDVCEVELDDGSTDLKIPGDYLL